MTLRSPVFAMLWENWRVTRVEVAWRLALGIVGGLAVLAVFSAQREVIKDISAAIALILIVLPHFVGWLSFAKLNSGRPGFPLYLLYTRSVRTSVIVAVPMAYLAAMPAALYFVSALLLRVTSGYAFPLVPEWAGQCTRSNASSSTTSCSSSARPSSGGSCFFFGQTSRGLRTSAFPF